MEVVFREQVLRKDESLVAGEAWKDANLNFDAAFRCIKALTEAEGLPAMNRA